MLLDKTACGIRQASPKRHARCWYRILSRIVENFIDAKRATKGFDFRSLFASRETRLDGFYALRAFPIQRAVRGSN
jgi:hypothetical protein